MRRTREHDAASDDRRIRAEPISPECFRQNDDRCGAGPAPEGFEPLTLRVANGTFGQAGVPFRADYLDLLARAYGAPLEVLSHGGMPVVVEQYPDFDAADVTPEEHHEHVRGGP